MPFIGRVGRPGILGLAARTAVVAGTATAVSGRVATRQQRRAADQAAVAAAKAQAAAVDAAPDEPDAADPLIGKFQQLAALHEQGVLTDSEFQAAKSRLLNL